MKHTVAKAIAGTIVGVASMTATYATLINGWMPTLGWFTVLYSLPFVIGVICWYAIAVAIALGFGYLLGLLTKSTEDR